MHRRRTGAALLGISVFALVPWVGRSADERPARLLASTMVGALRSGGSSDCDAQLVGERLNGLFRALGKGSTARVARFFPKAGEWSFAVTGSDDVVSAGGGVRIRAQPDVERQLLEAVQSHDARAVIALFPAAGGWFFDVVPTVHGFVDGGRFADDGEAAARRKELRRIVADFRGLDLSLSSLNGRVWTTDYVSPKGTAWVRTFSGELRWRGRVDPRDAAGTRAIEGGGKIALYCENGLFGRIALSPSTAITTN